MIVAMERWSYKSFLEEELGDFPLFVSYAIFELIITTILLLDGFLAFAASEIAKIFGMRVPCLLCSRIDRALAHGHRDCYYNESMCESHKREVSSLAYCYVHKKLSDIRQMCEGCLLSYATEKQSECDTYKSRVGILHKDLGFFIQDECLVQSLLPTWKKPRSSPSIEPSYKDLASDQRCCCCGEPLRVYSSSNLKGKEEDRARSAPPFKDPEEDNEAPRTPNFSHHKFFGIPLSDSENLSPRWSNWSLKRSLTEKMEFAPQDSMDMNASSNDPENFSIMNQLRKKIRLDGKSLLALYMELDEEKSASEVAANNAMAMITRLQAEKAAVQMEAMQYQRMMEEQTEYDQEALQETNDLLDEREHELNILEAELEVYRKRFGCLKEDDYQLFKDDILPDNTLAGYAQNDHQETLE